jgi:uncharacterized protein (DUF2147 family)
MKQKLGFVLEIIVVAIFTTSSLWAADPIIGKWKTVDDETKNVTSVVEIYIQDGKAFGRITELLNPKDKKNICTKCTGADKGKPIEGMVIIKNMKDDGSEWTGGTILDPDKGKEYTCKVKAIEDGNKLQVKGCIAFLCRSQVWLKAK